MATTDQILYRASAANAILASQRSAFQRSDGSLDADKLRAALLRRKDELAASGIHAGLASQPGIERNEAYQQLLEVDALLANLPVGGSGPSDFIGSAQAIPTPQGTFNPIEAATSVGLNPAKLGFGVGGVLLGAAAVGTGVALVRRRRSSKRRRQSSTGKAMKRRTGRKLKFGSPAYRKKYLGKGRRKKRYGTAKQYRRPGGKSVKYTKNGQPYIILANGKARFVKGRRKA